MSKRREYKKMTPTDAPQQKPGTQKQAHATQVHLEAELRAQAERRTHPEKRQDEPGSEGPTVIDDTEMP